MEIAIANRMISGSLAFGTGTTWPMTKVFGFVARPGMHFFMNLRFSAREAARRYGFELAISLVRTGRITMRDLIL